MYWEFEHNDKLSDWECETRDELLFDVKEWFAEHCLMNYTLRNRDVVMDTVYIVLLDDDKKEVSREKYNLSYEHYHGDLAEHRTNY